MGRLPYKTDADKKVYICRLWDNHKEIIRRISVGQKAVDIAREMKISLPVVSYTRNSPLGKELLGELHRERDAEASAVSKRIADLAPKCLDVLESALTDSPIHIRVQTAKDLLEKAGFGAVQKTEVKSSLQILSREDIEEIRARAMKAGILAITAQDAEEVPLLAMGE